MSSLFRLTNRMIIPKLFDRPLARNVIPFTAKTPHSLDKFHLSKQQISPIQTLRNRKSILSIIREKISYFVANHPFKEIEPDISFSDKEKARVEIGKMCNLFYKNDKNASSGLKQEALRNFLCDPQVQKTLKHVWVDYDSKGVPSHIHYIFRTGIHNGIEPFTLKGAGDMQIARNLFSTECPLPADILSQFPFQESLPSQDQSFTIQYRREKRT